MRCRITSHVDAVDEKCIKEQTTSHNQPVISHRFPLYAAVSLFFLYLHICFPPSLLLSISSKLPLFFAHSSSQLLSIFIFFILFLFLGSLSGAALYVFSLVLAFHSMQLQLPHLGKVGRSCLLDRDVTRELYLLD